jgi:hypothetical protein
MLIVWASLTLGTSFCPVYNMHEFGFSIMYWTVNESESACLTETSVENKRKGLAEEPLFATGSLHRVQLAGRLQRREFKIQQRVNKITFPKLHFR